MCWRVFLSLVLLVPVTYALEPQDAASYFGTEAVTPQQAELCLESMRSPLIHNSEGDHVNSYYYFGVHHDRTLIGLERVKGADYSQYFSLLVFDQTTLLGYYRNIASLPLFIEPDGQLSFPRGVELADTIYIDQDEFPALCLAGQPCVEWVSVGTRCELSTD